MSPGAIALALLPQKLSGRIVYRAARSERVWLKNLLIAGFCRFVDIDLGEAAIGDKNAYRSLNQFFTRELKPGARPVASGDDVIVSPADGRLAEFGRLDGERLVQAKGKTYTLDALLAEPAELIASFRGGSFLTIYLAPHNYHRVHAPVACRLDRGRYVPGKRYCVNAKTTERIDGLYCRNERVALWLSTAFGYSSVVMIGALNVASLATRLTGEIESGRERVFAAEAPPAIAAGDELGQFNLGSTVVMLFPAGTVDWLDTLELGQAVRMGQALGRIRAADAR